MRVSNAVRKRPWKARPRFAVASAGWIPFAIVVAAGLASTAGAVCQHADCNTSVFPSPNVIVGSPSGLVGTYSVTFKDVHGTPLSVEGWLAEDTEVCNEGDCLGGTLLYSPTTDGELECGNSCTNWPYIIANSDASGVATWHPRFGGHGTLAVQHETPCNCGGGASIGYNGLLCVQARSTDFNADGRTDQTDKLQMGRDIRSGNPPIWWDFDLNGVVNAADYNLVANEMMTEWNGGSVTPLYKCNGNCVPVGTCTPQALGNETGFVLDTNPPGAVPLGVACGSSNSTVVLTWNSPGNDTDNGVQIGVAKEFDIRWSSSPITAATFAAATPLTGEPAPGLPGTAHTMTVTVGSPAYFALRTLDHAGNASPVTSGGGVESVAPAAVTDLHSDCVSTTGLQLLFTAPGDDGTTGTALQYDIRYSESEITDANFTSAYQVANPPAPLSGGGSQVVTVNTGNTNPDLVRCHTYYFAIKTRDDACNWSPISTAFAVQMLCSGMGTCSEKAALEPPGVVDAPAPSPARESTRIVYRLPADQQGAPFSVTVYDVAGRLVRKLAAGTAANGEAVIDWNLRSDSGRQVQSGIYYVKLRAGAVDYVKSVVVAR